MDRLRKKIFLTLWTILSVFLLVLFAIFSYQDYSREKISVEQKLQRMSSSMNKTLQRQGVAFWVNGDGSLGVFEDEEDQKRFMDTTIYTVLLDRNDEVFGIVSHTENGLINDDVAEVVTQILTKATQSVTEVGNILFDDFAYRYEKGSYIILIDVRDIRERLMTSVKIVLILMVLAEINITIFSKMLGDWIIEPVEKSFERQRQFIADASHELKTPLAIIMSCAETLEENPKDEKRLLDIKNEAERMNKLITDLLDLAKVENENDKSRYVEIDLSKLVEKAVLSFESLAFEKNLQLDYAIQKKVVLKGDESELHELLSILLDNAIKHCHKKGKIRVELEQEKERIRLEVKNQGEPIPEGEEEKIFERFYRVDKSRNRKANRYGLGLAIAKNIVCNHGGEISANSKNGWTNFNVVFKI